MQIGGATLLHPPSTTSGLNVYGETLFACCVTFSTTLSRHWRYQVSLTMTMTFTYFCFMSFPAKNNRGLERLTCAWNNHPICTEGNWSLIQIWTNGMVDIRNNSINAVSDFHHGTAVDGLEWFGYDPDAPAPGDDRLSFVQVEDVNFDLPEVVLQELVLEVDPLEYSDIFGVDVYQKAFSTFLTAMESHE